MTDHTLAQAQALIDRGERLEARSLLASVPASSPDGLAARHLLATIDMDEGAFASAREKIIEVLKADPLNAAATYNLGVCLMREDLQDEALAMFREALRLDPKHSGAMYNVGYILRERGQYDEARLQLEQLVRHNIRWASAWEALIEIHLVRGRAEDAIAAADETVRLGISNARIQRLRGDALTSLGRIVEAEANYLAAIKEQANDVDAIHGLAELYANQGRYAEAIPLFERALLIAASDRQVADRFDPALSELIVNCRQLAEWRRLPVYEDQARVRVDAEQGRISPNVLRRFIDNPASMQAAARRVWPTFQPKASAGAPVAATPGKIRIGWLTDHLGDNAATHQLARLLEQRDRATFEVIGYSVGTNAPSDVRFAVRNAFDMFRGVAEFSEERIAEFIRADNLDILVCSLHTGSFWRPGILLRRPAPLMVSYAGHPGTLGNAVVSHIIADDVVLPAKDESFCDEKVVRLSGSYRPVIAADLSGTEKPTRAAFGLKDDAVVFCNFSPTLDVSPDTFRLWMQILKDVPNSQIWLGESRHSIRGILRSHATDCGVDANRLVFAALTTRQLRLAQTPLADIVLDTWPNQDFDTVHDALAVGVPVVSLAGQSFHSRTGQGLLSAAGLSALVTATTDAYRAKAVELAQAPAKLAEIRRNLAEAAHTSKLFDVRAHNAELLATLKRLVDAHRKA
jgi:predicted O-linked N-acetylglucosamine transferase (SPINDLY family)